MKACDYCGKENDDAGLFCFECGTEFAAREEVPSEPPIIQKQPGLLNARSATIILLSNVVAQILCGILIAIPFFLFADGFNSNYVLIRMRRLAPFLALFGAVLGGVVTVVLARVLVREQLRDTGPTGGAWVIGDRVAIAKGLGLGLLVGILFCFVLPLATDPDGGPAGRRGFAGAVSGLLWIVAVVFVAPPCEEILFRGIVYGGYRRSLGAIPAAALTTGFFILLHVPQTLRHPVALISIGAMAIVALWVRLRWQAIGPAIATHMGYNAVIAALLVYYSLTAGSVEFGPDRYNAALRRDPNNATLYVRRGFTYFSEGQMYTAIADFDRAIKLDPENARAYSLRGQAYVQKKKWTKAISDLSQAIRLRPDDIAAREGRALAYGSVGEYQKSVSDLKEILRLEPGESEALNSLAWLLATCPDDSLRDGKQAVEMAQQACEFTAWKKWYYLDTLAAAEAEAGNFDLAVHYQERSLSMKAVPRKDQADMKQRLQLYQQRRPYREAKPAQ